jgi:hypothetical protein
MTYKRFLDITLTLKKQVEIERELYKLNMDLMEFTNPFYKIIEQLIEEVYGEEGAEWYSWFCWENEFGQGALNAVDADNNPVCYDYKSLWEHLETLK